MRAGILSGIAERASLMMVSTTVGRNAPARHGLRVAAPS